MATETTCYLVGVCDLETALIAKLLNGVTSNSATESVTCWPVLVNPLTLEGSPDDIERALKSFFASVSGDASLRVVSVNIDKQVVEQVCGSRAFRNRQLIPEHIACPFVRKNPQSETESELTLLEQVVAHCPVQLSVSQTGLVQNAVCALHGQAERYVRETGDSIEDLCHLDLSIQQTAHKNVTTENQGDFVRTLLAEILPEGSDSLLVTDQESVTGKLLLKARESIDRLAKYNEQGSHGFRLVFLNSGRDRILPGESWLNETVVVETPFDDHWFAAEAALQVLKLNSALYNIGSADQPRRPDILVLAMVSRNGLIEQSALSLVGYYHCDQGATVKELASTLPAHIAVQYRLGRIGRLYCTDKTGIAAPLLSKLADSLLEETLRHQRPAVAFRSSFMRAFRLQAGYETGKLRNTAAVRKVFNMLCQQLVKQCETEGNAFKRKKTCPNDFAYWLRHIPPVWDGLAPCDSGHSRDSRNIDQGMFSCEWTPPDSSLCIKHGSEGVNSGWFNHTLELRISAIRLHFFYLDTVMLEWEVELADDGKHWSCQHAIARFKRYATNANLPVDTGNPPHGKTDQLPYWYRLLECVEDTTLSVGACLDRLHMLRFASSGFAADTGFEPHAFWEIWLKSAADPSGPSSDRVLKRGATATRDIETASGFVAAIFDQFISAAFDNTRPKNIDSFVGDLQCIGDDRAAHISSMVVAGDFPQMAHGRDFILNLCGRLRMADLPGDGSHYDADWEREEADSQVYKRWWQYGSLFSSTDQGFAYLGTGQFAYSQVHCTHMVRHYRRMFLLVQFYAAIVQGFQARVAAATRKMETERVKLTRDYVALLPKFYKFRNQLFFERLSSQLQANELFELMRSTSRGMQEYDSLEGQIERTQAYWDAYTERNAENRLRTLTAIGLPPAIMAGFNSLLKNDVWAQLKFVLYRYTNFLFDCSCRPDIAACQNTASTITAVPGKEWVWALASLLVIVVCRLGGLPSGIGGHLHSWWPKAMLHLVYWLPWLVLIAVIVEPFLP